MTSARALRERIREELRHEIMELARAQLGTCGAGALSLRAISRDLGMASSAVYRYFPSRDDLLTALIIDGYNAIGESAERADASRPRDDYTGRWMTVCRTIRGWAIAHPHEYALVYGSPLPGYHAPEGTIQPAARDKVVFGRIIADAHRTDALCLPDLAGEVPASLAEDARRLRAAAMPDVSDAVIVATLTAWGGLFGMINFELFGHFNNMIDDRTTLFDEATVRLARLIGLSA